MASMRMTVFWDVALCSLVEIGRCFTGAYCRHLQNGKPWWVRNYIINITLKYCKCVCLPNLKSSLILRTCIITRTCRRKGDWYEITRFRIVTKWLRTQKADLITWGLVCVWRCSNGVALLLLQVIFLLWRHVRLHLYKLVTSKYRFVSSISISDFYVSISLK
jgi:hypothetical protein